MDVQLGEYITLPEAARRAGYRSGSTLRTAALKGELKTVMVSRNARLTTQAWLDDYLAALRPGNPGKGYKRGLPKGQDAGSGEAGE